jgi:hypothetical protein
MTALEDLRNKIRCIPGRAASQYRCVLFPKITQEMADFRSNPFAGIANFRCNPCASFISAGHRPILLQIRAIQNP